MQDNIPGQSWGPFQELGSSGLRRWGGYIAEEFLKELQGSKAVKVYEEMRRNSPVVGSILFAVRMAFRRAKVTLEPASDAPEDIETRDFIASCLDGMDETWEDTLSEQTTFLDFGFAPCEINYRKDEDGRIRWSGLPLRGQSSLYNWVFEDATGKLLGMNQQAEPDYQLRFIPLEKMLLFRTGVEKGNPEGVSILRNAYRPWFFGKNIERIEAIGVERDLAGIPMAEVPASMLGANPSADEVAALVVIKKIVTQIRNDEQAGVVWPLAYDANGNQLFRLSLLTSGGKRNFDTSAIITRYDTRIAMSILADIILLGHGNVGSYALGQTKAEMFAAALDAWLDSIAAVYNRFAFPRLLALNTFRGKAPKMRFAKVSQASLGELGAFIQALSGAMVPLQTPEIQAALLERADLPVPVDQTQEIGKSALAKSDESTFTEAVTELLKTVREIRRA